MTQQPCDPFAESEARHIGKWKGLLLAEPELLVTQQKQADRIIRAWDEIPDVMTMVAPRTEWIVEGLIPRAAVTLLAGEPGSYKSWLALTLLRSVLTGGKFLERECTALDVLYLDRENPLTVVRERLA